MVRAGCLIVVWLGGAAAFADEPVSATTPVDAEVTQALAQGEKLEVHVAHDFARAVARERITQLLGYWSRRFGVQATWDGYRVFVAGKVWGIDFKALFDIGEHEVLALSSDPGSLMRNRATTYVERKLKKYLNPNYDEP